MWAIVTKPGGGAATITNHCTSVIQGMFLKNSTKIPKYSAGEVNKNPASIFRKCRIQN